MGGTGARVDPPLFGQGVVIRTARHYPGYPTAVASFSAGLLIDQRLAVLLHVCSALQLPALSPQLWFCCRQFSLCVQVASVCDTSAHWEAAMAASLLPCPVPPCKDLQRLPEHLPRVPFTELAVHFMGSYRTTEPLRLEKTSRIPMPNPSPAQLTHAHAHCLHPSVPHPRSSGTPPGMVPPHSLGSCASARLLFGEEIVPNTQPDTPWCNVRPSPLVPL